MCLEKGLSLSQFNGLPAPLLRQLDGFPSSTSHDSPIGTCVRRWGDTIWFKRVTTRKPENVTDVSSGIYPNLSALNLDCEYAGN